MPRTSAPPRADATWATGGSRDAILSAVSEVAELLLSTGPWTDVIDDVLRVLGRGADASRVVLFRIWEQDGVTYGGHPREWVADPAFSLAEAPELQAMPFAASGFARWERELRTGRSILGRTEDFPPDERPVLEAFHVKSCVIAPVVVDGELWAWLGFDDCGAARRWDPAQVDAVEAAARILAYAIARQRDHELLVEIDERLTRTLEHVPAGIAFVDPTGAITYANAEAERILRLEPSEVIDRTYNDPRWQIAALDGGPFPDEELPIARVLATGGPVRDVRHSIRHADGQVTALSVNAAPLHGSDGSMTGVLATINDITSQLAREAELARVAEDLRRSNDDLERFAYVVSHDLQEPLRMVTGFLSLLQQRYEGQLDEDGREFIGFAVDGSRRMSRMIVDLLEYSRVNTRGRPPDAVALATVVRDVLANLQSAMDDTGATVDVPEELPEVLADRSQLAMLLQNLLSNALKFHGDAPPHVKLSARLLGSWVEVTVADEGIGFEPGSAELIFEVFQRLHTRDVFPGNGIGLSVCRRIVERHGGTITATGSPGEGATFRFTLPAVPS